MKNLEGIVFNCEKPFGCGWSGPATDMVLIEKEHEDTIMCPVCRKCGLIVRFKPHKETYDDTYTTPEQKLMREMR